jgi:hypothetical protein
MESLIVNIDSRYRDYIKYPSENKFSINLGRNYKNVKAIKLLSIELNNTISYMDSIKKRKLYFTGWCSSHYCYIFRK